jgi:invasion protein IalB
VASPPVQPQAAPEAAAGPDRTSAVFGDWTLHCMPRHAPPAGGPPPGRGRVCEMVQTAQDQRGQTITAFGVARATRTDPLRLVALVPVNVQPAQPVRLVLEPPGAAATQAGRPAELALPFQNCQPRGCAAEAEMRDEAMLRRLRARPADQQGRLEWRDAAGQTRTIPVSFRGFAAALEALERETTSGG